jgi:tRNA dimethylallyltransferase
MLQKYREQIDRWIAQKSEKPKLIVIYGPTASGKTGLSIEIAEYLRSEIISVDSRQIYRGLDVGTGKVTESEKRWIKHHMLDICDPREKFSVVDFRNRVEKLDIWNEFQSTSQTPKIPVLCWGTGLYIDSLVFERSYPAIPADWDLRAELEKFRIANGNEALHQKLADIDPRYAAELHPNNYYYVIRGIEVYTKSGRSKLDAIDALTSKYDILWITPYDGDRPALYTRIDHRVLQMFASWLIGEVIYTVDNLFDGDLSKASSCPGLQTIGYREVMDHLCWEITLDRCISLVQQYNRNYAKRQITWNKKYDCY